MDLNLRIPVPGTQSSRLQHGLLDFCLSWTAVWGSSIFDYDFAIELPPRFIPLHMELTASNLEMTSGLRFDSKGCTVRICPSEYSQGEVRPWSTRVRLHFRDVGPEGAVFSRPSSPFLDWIAFKDWERLLARARSGSATS